MKTVKVRIAVAVDRDGVWHAAGWGSGGVPATDAAMDIAVEAIGPGEARYWVTAELPVPGEVEFAGAVEDGCETGSEG
jgi:hypothetical protein